MAALLLAPSLFGGKVLSAGDVLLFRPPFASERPADLTRPSNLALGDAVFLFDPHLYQARQAIRAGRLPTWNPDISAGRPHSSQQGGLLYPLHWLAYILPFWHSLAWIAALQLLIAALGTFFLCRALGLHPAAATLGGLAFAYGTAYAVYLEHPQASVFGLLPWMLLAVEHLCRSARVAPALALGGLMGAAVLAGHPESVFVASLGIAAFAAARLAGLRTELTRRDLGRRVALIVGGFALAGAVAAVLIVPFLEGLTQTETRTIGGPLLARSGLFSFFLPELWGRSDKLNFPAPDIFAGRPLYLGAFPLMLGAAGFVVRPARMQLAFAGMFAGSLLIAVDTPVAHVLRLLPVLSGMAVRHFLFLAMFAAAMLGAWGLDTLLRAPLAVLRRMTIAAAVVAILPLAWLLTHTGVLSEWRAALGQLPVLGRNPPSADAAALASVMRWTILAAVCVAAMALVWRRPSRALAVAVAAIALTGADLLTMDEGYHPQVAQSRAAPSPPPALRRVMSARTHQRTSGTSYALPPSIAELYGLRDVKGNELPTISRNLRLYRGLGGTSNSRGNVTGLDLRRPRVRDLLDLFSVRYLFVDDRDPLPTDGFRTLDSHPGERLVENLRAFPRAFVAYGWRSARNADDALRTTLATRPAQLLRAPVIERSTPPAGGPLPPPTPAAFAKDEPTEIHVRVRAARPGYLVLNDTYYPGWTARVDGREVPIEPANAAFRAVRVPPGRHAVSFDYASTAYTSGAAISGAGLLIILVGLAGPAVVRRRRR
jgi:hypothetical protein